MNVYSIHAYGNYAGGMAVIAAENEKQAIDLIMKSDNSIFSIDWNKPEKMLILPVQYDGKAGVLDYYVTGE